MKEKKNRSIKLLLGSLLLCLMVIFALPGIKVEAAAKVAMNKTSVSVYKGKNYKLTMQNVKTGTKVTWKSSNTGVAAIKVNGTSCTVTGKKAGTAVVSAKVGSKTYKCKVTVKNLPAALSAKTKTLKKGASFTLALKNTSSNATWSVSDKKILKLKKLGKNKYQVTGLKAGSAKVYAKIGSKKYTCTVKVSAPASTTVKVPSCAAQQTMYVNCSGVYVIGMPTEYSYPMVVLYGPERFIFIKNLDSSAKITAVKSSNPKLRAAKKAGMNAIEVMGPDLYSSSSDDIFMNPEEYDLTNVSSTISFKVTQKGKTYNLSCKVTVKKSAASPFSSFKLGNLDLAKYYKNGYGSVSYSYKEGKLGKQKVTVKMAPGYVLDKINIYRHEKINGVMTPVGKDIKNGTVVDLDKWRVSVIYHSTKTPANYTKPAKWTDPLESPLQIMYSVG